MNFKFQSDDKHIIGNKYDSLHLNHDFKMKLYHA